MNLALILTGGGARAAYQVGAIQAIAKISTFTKIPFNILTGSSAGALNVAYLASRADDFTKASQGLWDLWDNLSPEKVYKTDSFSMTALGVKWIRTLGGGGLYGVSTGINYLLDTSPLRELLIKELYLERLPQFFFDSVLRGVSVSATNYLSGTAISFYDGQRDIIPWVRSTRLSQHTQLNTDHIFASCAIPIFFTPVLMNGIYYGDGCIRLTSPLSPAVHMGADKILAIGIRHPKSHQETIELNQVQAKSNLSVAEIGGTLMNSVFLDSLETDIERMERINSTISVMSIEHRSLIPSKLRHIPVLALQPSRDLGELAIGTLHQFPRIIRHLLRGLGAKDNKGWDMISYLAFEKTYTRQLMDLGYLDTMKKNDLVLDFIEQGSR